MPVHSICERCNGVGIVSCCEVYDGDCDDVIISMGRNEDTPR